MKHLFPILILAFIAIHCNFDHSCIEPEGEAVQVRKEMEPFRYLRSNVNARIIYRQSDEFYIEWNGPANFLEEVSFEVNRESLDIRSDKCFRRAGDVWIIVATRELIELNMDGAGSFTGESLLGSPGHFSATLNGVGDISGEVQAESVSAIVNGAGNINLSGKVSNAKMAINGAGNVNAYELQTEHCTIEIAGSGSAQVSASSTLHVNITGAGSVHYQGEPEITRKVIGVGTIRQRTE